MPAITAGDSTESGVTNVDMSADMNAATSTVMSVATIAITMAGNRLQVDVNPR